MYGPITMLRRDNRVVKHIPWSAFKMSDQDWCRVVDARDILQVRFALTDIMALMKSRTVGFE